MDEAQLISSIYRYLGKMSKRTRERGEGLYQDGCVDESTIEFDEGRIGGEVVGSLGDIYETDLLMSPHGGRVIGYCDCPVGTNCKHSYALGKAVIAFLGKDGGRVLEQARTYSKQEVSELLLEAVMKRLNERKVNTRLRGYVKRAAELWPQYRTSGKIWQRNLEMFNNAYRFSTMPGFPEALELGEEEQEMEPLAFFNRLLFASVLHGYEPPVELMDAEVYKRQYASYKLAHRKEEVRVWRERFAQVSKQPRIEPRDEELGQRREIRLVLGEKGWFFELEEGEQWVKLTSHYSRTYGYDDWLKAMPKLSPEAGLFYGAFLALNQTISYNVQLEGFEGSQLLNQMLRGPLGRGRVVTPERKPVVYDPRPTAYDVELREGAAGRDAVLHLVNADGVRLEGEMEVFPASADGEVPAAMVVGGVLYDVPVKASGFDEAWDTEIVVPWEALGSEHGLGFLSATNSALPEQLEGRVEKVELGAVVRMEVEDLGGRVELEFFLDAETPEGYCLASYQGKDWMEHEAPVFERDIIPVFDWQRPAEALEHFKRWQFGYVYDGRFRMEMRESMLEPLSEWLCGFPKHTVLQVPADFSSLLEASRKARYQVKIEQDRSRRDWFNISAELKAEDIELSEEELALLLQARGRFVYLKGKGYQRIELDAADETAKLVERLGVDPDSKASQPYHTLQMQQWADVISENAPSGWDDCIKRINTVKVPKSPAVPGKLKGCLRSYQEEGFRFLCHLSQWGLGGILADDMGLGKTLQALAWLLWLKSLGKKKDAFRVLIVCPKSVMDNWVTEPVKFGTDLKSSVFEKGQVKLEAPVEDILIANYTQLRMQAEYFGGIEWNAVILDEGQYIKNPGSQTAQAAYALNTHHRLVLTGTPVENRLLDLWSLMRFAMPGLLGSRNSFSKLNNEKKNPEAPVHVGRRVQPFLLRRSKLQVAQDLPERVEEEIHCELEGKQWKLYEAELKVARQALLRSKDERQFNKNRFSILQSLLRMRQICCDARLVDASLSARTKSAKMESLMDLLLPLVEEGNKVLVFSQFVAQLDLISAELNKKKVAHLCLTGKTEERGKLVGRFQEADTEKVFLLSLKAAGSGLNLTAASYVVLYDPWWNPAVEAQAIDRTHRIGQTSQVIAYRIIAKNTIEEKIRAMQLEKSQLADTVIQEESLAKIMDLENLRRLLNE